MTDSQEAEKARPFRINFNVSIDCPSFELADGETEQELRDSIMRELRGDLEHCHLSWIEMEAEVFDWEFEELKETQP